MTFEAQTVFGVRFEATQSNDNWVAVSEFDIANKPAPTNSVYVASKSYAAAEDGTLDLTTGKAVDSVVSGTAGDLDDSKSVYRAEVKGGTELTLTAKPGEKLEFVGWFAPCSDEPVSEDLSYKVPTDYNVALEARFKRVDGGVTPDPEPKTFTVTFKADGKVVETVEVEEGKAVAKPATDPVKDGYTFVAWQLDGKDFDFATKVTSDIELVAKFQKNEDPEPPVNPDKPVNPDQPVNPDRPSGNKGDSLVQTGDASMAVAALSMLGGSGLLAAGYARARRRK